MRRHCLLFKYQSGFRSIYSTVATLLQVTNDVRINKDKKIATAFILLDFSSAFDSVSHSLLLRKLSFNFGFSTSASILVRDYLTCRSQGVFVNGCQSISIVTSFTRASSRLSAGTSIILYVYQ